ncbi:MAG: hypothetical protein JXJ22_14140 [Bacteroidales bacterium]|nr:hypothetical protein [Bacteroidales bacterium]
MKRIQILLLLIAASIIKLYSQPAIDEKFKENIVQHKIETRTQWDKSFMKNKPYSGEQKTAFTRYDKNGNITELLTYQAKDTLSLETYEYDYSGFRTEYTKRKGGGLIVAYKKISSYNQNGDLTLEQGYNGTENFKNEFSYTRNNKISEIKYYLENQLDEKRVFTHNGNQAAVEVFNKGGILISKLKLVYDSNKNLIEENLLAKNDKVTEKKIYSYDAKSNLVKEVKYREENFYNQTDYNYNASGDLVEIVENNPNDGKFVKKSFKYDNNGNLTEMLWRRNPSDEFSSKTYMYDQKGICTGVETFYPSTDFKIITKYSYEFF